jgi:predicted transcriptional regulator
MQIEYEYAMKVKDLLAELEAKYGSIEKLRARVRRAKKPTRAFADLKRWQAYGSKASAERMEDEIGFRTTVIFHDSREFFTYITPERVRLLDALRSGRTFESINELAEALARDPKNVYEDVKALESKGLVEVDRRNRRRSSPRAKVRRVVVTI